MEKSNLETWEATLLNVVQSLHLGVAWLIARTAKQYGIKEPNSRTEFSLDDRSFVIVTRIPLDAIRFTAPCN